MQVQQEPHVSANEAGKIDNPVEMPIKKQSEVIMAYVTSTRATSLSDMAARVWHSVQLSMQRRSVYAQTLAELRHLSDRDLADLGLHRSMIRDVARAAAYGK